MSVGVPCRSVRHVSSLAMYGHSLKKILNACVSVSLTDSRYSVDLDY